MSDKIYAEFLAREALQSAFVHKITCNSAFTLATCYQTSSATSAEHVASVKGLGHKLPNLLLNLCPSPFTLATCVATSLPGA